MNKYIHTYTHKYMIYSYLHSDQHEHSNQGGKDERGRGVELQRDEAGEASRLTNRRSNLLFVYLYTHVLIYQSIYLFYLSNYI